MWDAPRVDRPTRGRTTVSGRTLLRTGVTAAAGPAEGPSWDTLRRQLTGQLVLPSDSIYNQARQLRVAMFRRDPAAGGRLLPEHRGRQGVPGVRPVNDMRFSVPSGGHSTGGYPTTGLVVDVSRLNGVTVGPTTTTVAPVRGRSTCSTRCPHGVALPGGRSRTSPTGTR